MVHDLYLAQVKSPAGSKDSSGCHKILAVIPGEEALALAAVKERLLDAEAVNSADQRRGRGRRRRREGET